MDVRKIIHIDMDSFYVSVEIRDNPALENQLVAVGGQPGKRGVIATCNYQARQYGVHSAMASSRAKQLCPKLIIISGNMAKYKQVSQQIMAICREFTEKVEPLSLDEAYLDVSETTQCHGSATLIAKTIRQKIFTQTGLTASAGVGPNKLIAKIASDINKPNGLCVVPPEQVDAFIRPLPVNKLFGVGKATLQKLQRLGIESCGDLQKIKQTTLQTQLGRFGHALYHYCRGIDERPVNPKRVRKSMSVEHTYEEDIANLTNVNQLAQALVEDLQKRLATLTQTPAIKSVNVKLKFNDFSQTTAETQADTITLECIQHLFERAYARVQKPIRLMGVGVGFKPPTTTSNSAIQLPLF